jgi:hypothetical protein
MTAKDSPGSCDVAVRGRGLPGKPQPSMSYTLPGAEQPWLPVIAPGEITQEKKVLTLSIFLRNTLIWRFSEMYARKKKKRNRC